MIYVKKIIKNEVIILGLIILLGFILRLIYFNAITFGYDQGRDAFEAISILKNFDIKIIGPTTDITGLFHGPLYWYIISPFYFIAGGNPDFPRLIMIILNLVNVILIYWFAMTIFGKNKIIGYTSALLMAASFESTQYARWLSNPPLALITIAVFAYGVWLVFINKKSTGLLIMLSAWSMSINFQFFLVYHGVFIVTGLIWLYIKNKKELFHTFKTKWYWLFIPFIFFLPFIISELKFKFQGLRAMMQFFVKTGGGDVTIFSKLFNFYISIYKNVSHLLSGGNTAFGQILLIFLIITSVYLYKKKAELKKPLIFLWVWFLSPMIIYPVEKNNSYFLNIGNLYPLIMIISLSLYYLSGRLSKLKIYLITGILILIFSGNFYQILKFNKTGESLFSVQMGQILNDEKRVIDYIYQESKGKQFSINTVTNPFFVNTAWSYLFDWYGRSVYQRMPVWLGYDQKGTFGSHVVYETRKGNIGMELYVIYEPFQGMPKYYVNGYSHYEDSRSKIVETKKIGGFLIERRVIFNNNGFSREELVQHINKINRY